MNSVVKYNVLLAQKNIPWNNSYVNAVRVTDFPSFDEYLKLFEIINDNGSLANYAFKRFDSVNASLVVDFKNDGYKGNIDEYLNLNYCKVIATLSDGSTKKYYFFITKAFANSYCRITFTLTLDVFATYPLNIAYQINYVFCRRRHQSRYTNEGFRLDPDNSWDSNLNKKEEIENAFSNRDVVFDLENDIGDPIFSSSLTKDYKENNKGWLVFIYSFNEFDLPSGWQNTDCFNLRINNINFPLLCFASPIGKYGFYGKKIDYDSELKSFLRNLRLSNFNSKINLRIVEGANRNLTADVNLNLVSVFVSRFCPFDTNDYLKINENEKNIICRNENLDIGHLENAEGYDEKVYFFGKYPIDIMTDIKFFNFEFVNVGNHYQESFLNNCCVKVNRLRSSFKWMTGDAFPYDLKVDKIKNIFPFLQNGKIVFDKEKEFNHKDPKLLKFPFSSIELSSSYMGDFEYNIFDIGFTDNDQNLRSFIYSGTNLLIDGTFDYDFIKLNNKTQNFSFNQKLGLFSETHFNLPILSNAYIDMIQTNKNYLNKHYLNFGTSMASSALSTGAQLLSGNVIGTITNGLNGFMSGLNSQLNFNQNIENLKSTPSKLSNSDLNLYSLNYLNSYLTKLHFRTISEMEQTQVADYFHKYGYTDEQLSSSAQWINRYIFNYIQTEGDIRGAILELDGRNFSEEIKTIISNAFQRGLTLWEWDYEHLHFFRPDFENWEWEILINEKNK